MAVTWQWLADSESALIFGGDSNARTRKSPVKLNMSIDAAYRASVIAMASATASSLPRVVPGGAAPLVQALAYHHLGLGCRSVPASVAFYAQLGWSILPGGDLASSRGKSIVRLKHANDLELHLVAADDEAPTSADDSPLNILMDVPTVKPPGHTHASWTVPSVPSASAFLGARGIAISGTRSTLAVFVRDVDRTTLEFERNDGNDSPPDAFGPEHIGAGRTLDHVGIRTRAPHDRHTRWYAETLGFSGLARRYDVDADPLKNGSPWITRTPSGCDINFIPNCNTPAPADGEAAENALLAGGRVLPGILYASFAVDATDAATLLDRLRAAGVVAALDSDAAAIGVPPHIIAPIQVPTVLLRDLCGTLLRLVPTVTTGAA